MSSRQDEPVPQEPHKEAGSPACPAQWVGAAGTAQDPQSRSRHVTEVVQRVLQPLSLSLQQLSRVQHHMLAAMEAGLRLRKGAHTVPMLPTYVRSTPDGTERGSFLVLELRERDLRVLRAELGGSQEAQLKDRIFAVPQDLREGKGEKLFDFMAKSLCQFLDDLHIPATSHQLGFCFPFTCITTGLETSKLQSWSKGYSCSGVVGRDVGQLLQAAIQRQASHDINVMVVVNDTVATMMGCRLGTKPCEVGLIVGAGTNSCFMEEARYVESLDDNEGRMCVNTEWGTFGDTGAMADILTTYDEHVDAGSLNKGKHRFEKLIGSLYLGEIARLLLVQLAQDKALHAGGTTPQLRTQGMVTALEVLNISEDQGGLAAAQCLLQKLGLQPSDPDCFTVQQVCLAVVTRAACLCATSLAAMLTHMRKNRELPQLDVCVGVDGDTFQARRFRQTLLEMTKKLAPECTATLVSAVDDSRAQGVAVVAAVALRLEAQRREVDQLLQPLRLAPRARQQVQALLQCEMERGLRQETHAQASTRMLPTYVRATPDGSERGDFLALDLGGTNFRVLLVKLRSREAGGICMVSEIYSIPPEVAQGPGSQLFDHIVECIVDFQTKQGLWGRTLPLGFTFSFPCQQKSLDQGILLNWTKGFTASGCEGKDVVELLREAVRRKNQFDLDVVAIVNDTVGTMMSCGYDDPNCEVGLIVGTGTNACYMEELRNVEAVPGAEGRMCINMEWGAFGDNGCLDEFFTHFDAQVDRVSLNPGKQRFEKLISGMYLGEIVRMVLVELVEKELLFQGRPCPALQTPGIFPTKFLSTIESDGLALRQASAVLQNLGLAASVEDALLVRKVCQVVSLRAGQLCGAALAAVAEKIRDNRGLAQLAVTVGVDGTLYKLHPHFSQHVQQTVKELAPRCTVTFLQSEDGSGKGAALVAAVACRIAQSRAAPATGQ
ncbi:PREDICTED: hexokinase-3 [Crocodylus porosus]|uniref:hexokinase-3 n=1 Tax=Crocodylus porosus TaxID=8502 RepID=UPI00093B9EB2|nr:PREDICTED: hexokinase-3 [Crocodylus porosus]XP_019390875.1 PREDICTED: hexokinase-3 [Crocodylus porosus]